MKLYQLLDGLDLKKKLENTAADLIVHGLADNSKDVDRGDLFVAIKGLGSDGHDYIDNAIAKGAAVIVGEQPSADLSIPYIQVVNSRKALGIIANNFYGDPSKQKVMIGITGTNGKTTTSYMLKHLLESNGKTCSVIGTIQNIINGERTPSSNTTPSSLLLNKLIALSNDEVMIMEVSSHGLTQHRLEGIAFDYCLFTNLHPEHLDYHRSMEDYFQAKLLLFKQLNPAGKVIANTANPWGEKLTDTLQNEGKLVYQIGKSDKSQLRIIDFDLQNSIVSFEENNECNAAFSSISGIHNMYNTLMAYGTAKLMGLSKESILQSLREFEGVDGRFEVSKQANGATIIVDYAHTPDAIVHCLTTAKQCGANRIIHIFGFRGDRDSSKRDEMLTLTAQLSDQYILTSDDLNSVSSKEMLETCTQLNDNYGNEKGRIILDRTLAVEKAIQESRMGDWILITGKGHEKYQQDFQLPTKTDRETIEFISKLQ